MGIFFFFFNEYEGGREIWRCREVVEVEWSCMVQYTGWRMLREQL